MNREEVQRDIESNIHFAFSRSGGAGGQNVNKVNTRVTARLPLSLLTVFSLEQLERVRTRLAGRINEADELVVHVDQERSQLRNREIALFRVIDLVLVAAARRNPRHATRPTASSRENRLKTKHLHSRKKRSRGRPDSFED